MMSSLVVSVRDVRMDGRRGRLLAISFRHDGLLSNSKFGFRAKWASPERHQGTGSVPSTYGAFGVVN